MLGPESADDVVGPIKGQQLSRLAALPADDAASYVQSLRHITRHAEALEAQALDLAVRHTDLHSAFCDQQMSTDCLRRKIDSQENEISRLQLEMQNALDSRSALERALRSERAALTDLRTALELGQGVLDEAQRDIEELCTLRETAVKQAARIEHLEQLLSRARAEATDDPLRQSAEAALRQMRARCEQLEGRVRELRAEIIRGENYVRTLLVQIQEKDAEMSRGSEYAKKLEVELVERNRRYEALSLVLRDIRNLISGCVDGLLAHISEPPLLRETCEDASRTDVVVTSLQGEAAHLLRVTTAVRASRLAKLKRLIRRVLP